MTDTPGMESKKRRPSAWRTLSVAVAAIALFVLILGNLPPMDAHDHAHGDGLAAADAPSSSPAAAKAAWLKGYARSISGETIGYHSSYPDATSALLVRATDGRMAVEWETEPVPAGFDAPEASFIWLCGLASGKGAHRFDLTVDGRPGFSFRTAADTGAKDWEIPGPDGLSLSFKTTLVDQFGELFGFMTLRVPRAALTPGRPLRLRVAGENGGSPDWHMVFQYELKPFVQAAGEPAVLANGGHPGQLIRIAVSHIAPPATAELKIDGASAKSVRLETGYNTFYLPVPAVQAPRRAVVEVVPAGGEPSRLEVDLRPVTPRTFYLLPHSHTDIGYSSHQIKVEADHQAYIDQALELVRKTASYPEGARFKWNSEVLWAVETYLRRASAEKRDAFLRAVREGSIGLQALLANELTGVCHPEELIELTAYARRLERDFGLTIDNAMISDIPSYAWGVVPALAQAGVKYLSSGPNYMPVNADGGDRIGGALKAWGDKPFYWVSPSGREKILLWMAGHGYSWFHGMNMGQLTADKGQPVFDYCRELEAKSYPYEMVQVRYTVGGDNGPPDPALPDVVRRWNEAFVTPKLAIATAGELFAAFEKRYGASLPSVQGDFTPYWEDGAGSTARESAMNRRSVVRLLQAETLWAMRDPKGYPAAAFAEAWRQALLWDEHTWGASDSIGDPDGENAKSQWAYKQAFALEADKQSRQLLTAIAGRDEKGESARFRVFNTCSFERTGVVIAPAGPAAKGDRVTDEQGRPVPSQRLKDGTLAVLAAGVPAFGEKSFVIGPGRPVSDAVATAAGAVLRNDNLEAIVDPVSGAVKSLRWLAKGGQELVDAAALPGLNSYYYVPGLDPKAAAGAQAGRVSIGEAGPLVASLIVESDAPGCRGLRREYRLTAGASRLEIIDRLDKSMIRTKESVHLGFPFRVPGGTLRFDLGWGWIVPGRDQIAGSCFDFYCPQNAADISNGEWGVTWVTLDAPLAELGRMTDESRGPKGTRTWRTSVEPSQTVYSYAMNNYWHTNYKADQGGPVELRYAVEPHAGSGRAIAKRIGQDAERPLVVSTAGESALGPIPIFSNPDIVATSLKPVDGGSALLIRLFNAADRPAEIRLPVRAGLRIFRAGIDGERGAAPAGPLVLAAREFVSLRLEFAP